MCRRGQVNLPALGLALALAVLAGGCAIGRTEFKVVNAAGTPVLTPMATPVAPVAADNTSTAAVGTKEAETETIEYTVEPGDSLWRICRRQLGDPLLALRVARANQITQPDLIQPGQKLKLDLSWKQAGFKPASGEAAPGVLAKESVPAPQAQKPLPASALEFPNRPNAAFKPGEHLLFAVQYFNIAAGFAALDVENGVPKNGRDTYHLLATARTHPAFEWIFKVRDRIESYFDQQGLFSWQYEKHLREGGYTNDTVMIYDQLHRKVIQDEGRKSVDAAPWVQDVLSEFYFFRTLPFKLGDTVTVPVFADDGKGYELLVSVVKKERVTVPAGTFDCIVVEPALKFEGLFQQKGKVTIWLTDDEHRVPVLIKTQIVIGTIDIVLREAKIVE
jgi:LysM repeat protein